MLLLFCFFRRIGFQVVKRRPLLRLVESQTREAPERRVCEAREYYITYAKRTDRKPVRGIQIVGTAQRKLGGQRGGEGMERERGNLSRFLPSFFISIRPRIRAAFRYPNAEQSVFLASVLYLTLRLASVQTFHLTVGVFWTKKKYGLFCSLKVE